MEEGGAFRFIFTEHYKSMTVNKEQVVINNSHYFNGTVFEIRDNNRICLSSDPAHKIILDPIDHGLSFMVYNNYYIDDNLNLQEDEDDAIIVQIAEVDDINDMIYDGASDPRLKTHLDIVFNHSNKKSSGVTKSDAVILRFMFECYLGIDTSEYIPLKRLITAGEMRIYTKFYDALFQVHKMLVFHDSY